MNYQDFVRLEFFHNTIQDYLIALLLFVILFAVARIFRGFILTKFKSFAQKTSTKLDDTIVETLSSIHPLFYDLIAFYCALQALNFTSKFDTIVHNIFLTIVIVQCLIVAQKILEYILHSILKDNRYNSTDQMMFSGISVFIRIGLWSTGILLLISNMGLNVNSLITSLGIGGVAVALAAQNIFADLFSSFSIYFDKPFVVGDSIEIGSDAGTVFKIGLKTTRIQSTQGEEIVISNRELTSARIHNFRKMDKRRVVFTLSLDYANDAQQVKEVSSILRRIFAEFKNLELDRATLKEFAERGINYEVVYLNPGNDYKECMQAREQLNFRIKEEFDKAQIQFAVKTT